jgi:poly(3-hydroxyalkanoate) synthetase
LNQKFWNYTFDDMGYFDVVANVHYILQMTSKKDLTFIGWSQGTTQMFIAAQGPDREYLNSHVQLGTNIWFQTFFQYFPISIPAKTMRNCKRRYFGG